MKFHRGRLIDHVHLRARDFPKTRRFYEAVAETLGIGIDYSGDHWLAIDELYIDAADGETPPTHLHLAFQADGPEMVQAFHRAAIGAGGTDNGAPGERPYHPGYYAAFVLDPDGNNIEAVYHGPATRSAAAIEIETPG